MPHDYQFVSAFVDSCISTPPPPFSRPLDFPLSPMLASSDACSQLVSASPLCHVVMKCSAASTTPRYHFPLFFAALGHHTVSTPNSKRELSVDTSVVWNTLMSARHWPQFFSGRPRSDFSPLAIVPNITRCVSRSSVVRCTPPAKRRRRLKHY